jgi:hypothetical protein
MASRFNLVIGLGAALALPALFAIGCRPAEPPVPAIHIHGPITPAQRAAYAGSKACVECHADYGDQLTSHHALTLAPTTAQSDGERFARAVPRQDAVNGVAYVTALEAAECVLYADAGGKKARVTAEYGFGSGNRGVTYIGRYGGETVELRLSFDRQRVWEFTPGQPVGARPQTPVGRILPAHEEMECFRCHTTALVARDGRPDPASSLLGVGCESCHGPGADHIAAARRKDRDLRMPRLSLVRDRISTELCGQCHRSPASADAQHPLIQEQLPRFQGLALSRSACFIQSKGRLSCVTCHDPHRNAAAHTRRHYNQQCVGCHTPGRDAAACPRPPASDCVSCHMPAQEVDLPARPRFATHWIKIWGPAGTPADSPPKVGSSLGRR